MDTSPTFAPSSLITPERLAADPQAALAALPHWVHKIEFVTPETGPEAHPAVQPIVFIWAGETHILYEAHTPLAAALMWEITKLPGVSIAVNTNGSKARYFRFTIAEVEEDLTTVARFLKNVGTDEQVLKTPARKWDQRPETLMTRPARKASKDSRAVLMGHIERIAKEWEASGKMPAHLTAAEYIANLYRLLVLLDQEAIGRELCDLLPTMREA
ncbi:MAG: hypothetical protein M9945_02300 [Aquamicrobium sp.]|uniref:hypothetical protein n=1 Tax=Aquamicrobium sp. TaxID=1872579 RepID=UPI00349E57D1|nr:hypothetical protein [Aquamicrobium sp.]